MLLFSFYSIIYQVFLLNQSPRYFVKIELESNLCKIETDIFFCNLQQISYLLSPSILKPEITSEITIIIVITVFFRNIFSNLYFYPQNDE